MKNEEQAFNGILFGLLDSLSFGSSVCLRYHWHAHMIDRAISKASGPSIGQLSKAALKKNFRLKHALGVQT
eukprot:3481029-Amphidinium_carterae.1